MLESLKWFLFATTSGCVGDIQRLVLFNPCKHTTSFWRCYTVAWTSTTLLQHLNNVNVSKQTCWEGKCFSFFLRSGFLGISFSKESNICLFVDWLSLCWFTNRLTLLWKCLDINWFRISWMVKRFFGHLLKESLLKSCQLFISLFVMCYIYTL